jgi:hypothetical protein
VTKELPSPNRFLLLRRATKTSLDVRIHVSPSTPLGAVPAARFADGRTRGGLQKVTCPSVRSLLVRPHVAFLLVHLSLECSVTCLLQIVTHVLSLVSHMALNNVAMCLHLVLTCGFITHVHVALLCFATCRHWSVTRVASVLVHVPPLDCDTCRHLLWTRDVSEYVHMPLSYGATCHLSVCQRIALSFCHVHLSGNDTWRRRGNFLFVLMSPPGSDTSHIPIGPCVLSTCRVRVHTCLFPIGPCVHFLLDHASISCSRECLFRTTTCPKPVC